MSWVLASLFACLVPLVLSPVEDAPVRLMSFNIRYDNPNDGENRWEKRREMVCQLIRDEKPDVLGVQEALRMQLDQIERVLTEYASVGVGRDDGKSAGEHSQILYRADRFRLEEKGTFWFSDTPDVPGSKHWGNTVIRICTWARLKDKTTGRAFYVYNLHLDHQSQPSRVKSVELLLKRIQSREHKDPVVVMGDFNAGEDNAAVTAIKEAKEPKLQDSFRTIQPQATEVGTFHGFRGKADPEKIDYIFVTEEFAVETAGILLNNDKGRYPSDHFPVTACCRLKL
jgi:endonuclease/exonuclease/phosphatase family metal-dependent hydrolase